MAKKKAAQKKKAAVRKKCRYRNTATAEMRFPLDVLFVSSELGLSTSSHEGCVKSLIINPAVRTYGFTDLQEEAENVIREGKVNTVFIDPCALTWDATPFILSIRSSSPKIVFVLYADTACRQRVCAAHPRFSKYFHLERFESYRYCTKDDEIAEYQVKLDSVVRQCEEWLRRTYQYDFAISFAGDQRAYAEELAENLSVRFVRVFYDRFEQDGLLGTDLYTKLYEVYSQLARFCVMLISQSYVSKVWTTLERQAIQERLLLDKAQGYVIPVRIDDTVVPGLPAALAYANIQDGVDVLAGNLIQRVSIPPSRLQNKKCFCDTRSSIPGRWTRRFYQDPRTKTALDKLEEVVARGRIEETREHRLVRSRISAIKDSPGCRDEVRILRALAEAYKTDTPSQG